MLRAADTIAQTDTGRHRPVNEDSAFARAPVFVVADGMGGAQAGEVASRIAVEAFEQGLPEDGTPAERLAARAKEANRRIYDLSQAAQERAGMGTTLTAAYLDDSELAIAHVGDSRAYLFRGGELKRLTQDHSLVEELKARGKLTEEQAAEHPQRSIITRALGPEPTVEVDTWNYPVKAGDVLLLCSDGLTSMLSEDRVAAILRDADTLQHAAQSLIDEANEAGGRDNITVVLFRLEEVGADHAAMASSSLEETRITAPAQTDGASTAQQVAIPVAPPPSVREERPARAPRLARTQGRRAAAGQGGAPANQRRFTKPIAALIAVIVVLFLVGGGGYLATRQLYFIGTNSHGIITIYRGLPYDLPAGIHLYESYYVSGVPASEIPADRRATLLNHNLRSESSAAQLVRQAELGQLTR
jgi:serine/threonine protein phosphatase PrpC